MTDDAPATKPRKLWSHAAAQELDQLQRLADSRRAQGDEAGASEVMTRWYDLQAALSMRYGNSILMVLPLPSGHWAIFGADRQLIEIREALPAGQELADLSRESGIRLSPKEKASSSELSMEDLGI